MHLTPVAVPAALHPTPVQEEAEWLVVDAGSVVVHVFLEGYRKEYDLEELWGDKDGSNLTWLEPKQTVHTLHTISV